jgi:hypothetical protein
VPALPRGGEVVLVLGSVFAGDRPPRDAGLERLHPLAEGDHLLGIVRVDAGRPEAEAVQDRVGALLKIVVSVVVAPLLLSLRRLAALGLPAGGLVGLGVLAAGPASLPRLLFGLAALLGALVIIMIIVEDLTGLAVDNGALLVVLLRAGKRVELRRDAAARRRSASR